jgi:hypothetical protein
MFSRLSLSVLKVSVSVDLSFVSIFSAMCLRVQMICGTNTSSSIDAYSAYGSEGVVRAIQILKDEMEMNMRLIGAPTLADVTPQMVDISALRTRTISGLSDNLFNDNYEGLTSRDFIKPQPKSKL